MAVLELAVWSQSYVRSSSRAVSWWTPMTPNFFTPHFNMLAYIYYNTHIYLYVLESRIGPRFAILGQNWSEFQVFFVCLLSFLGFFFRVYYSFCRENGIKNNKMFKIDHFHGSKIAQTLVQVCCATCLDQFSTHAWTSFWHVNLDKFWSFLTFAETTIVSVFSKVCMFKPTPKIRNTICEHNCANWENIWGCFSAFYVFAFLPCLFLFPIGMKTKSKNQPDNMIQKKKQSC